jgi:hypothetical protein
MNFPPVWSGFDLRQAQLWKVFGHAGAVAFSRTSDFEIGKFNHIGAYFDFTSLNALPQVIHEASLLLGE